MEIIKKYKTASVLLLVAVVGAFAFFYRMQSNDIKALNKFSASYENFDKAISDYSISAFASNPDLKKPMPRKKSQ